MSERVAEIVRGGEQVTLYDGSDSWCDSGGSWFKSGGEAKAIVPLLNFKNEVRGGGHRSVRAEEEQWKNDAEHY